MGAWGARFSHGFEANSLPRMAAAPAEQVENCFRVALDVACEQQAKTSERRAATSLAQLWSDRGERQRSHDLLAPIYGWFTDGFGTRDLIEAKTLLDAVGPIGEIRDHPTGGKLRGNIRKWKLNYARTIIRGRDGDPMFTGNQRPLDLHLRGPVLLGEAPRYVRAACRRKRMQACFVSSCEVLGLPCRSTYEGDAAIANGSGSFNHGHTYMGHAVCCAAALAVQQVIKNEDLLSNVQRQGVALHELLRQRFGTHPYVGDIRGRGLLRAIELVKDRETKQPFAASLKLHARIKQQAMGQGLICYPGGGTADGDSGDHVLVAPPFNVTDSQLEQIVASLGSAVDAAIKALPR